MIKQDFSETVSTQDKLGKDIYDLVQTESRTNSDELYDDMLHTDLSNKNVIAVVDRVIKNSDGTELFEYIGMNATTLGGTQTLVVNNYDNLDPMQIMKLNTIDGSDALPNNWSFDPVEAAPDPLVPRKIFGCMLGSDGAVGMTVKVVNRRSASFSIPDVLPFYRADSTLDDPVRYMNIATTEVNNKPMSHDDASVVRTMIRDGKYALRINISSDDGTFANNAYLVKLLTFDISNIKINGELVSSNDDTDKPSLDVRSRVRTRITIDAGILTKSLTQNNNVDKADTRGMTLSSISLVAGKPAVVKAGEKLIRTYRDVIVTNKINFTEIPIESEDLDFRYTLYYV